MKTLNYFVLFIFFFVSCNKESEENEFINFQNEVNQYQFKNMLQLNIERVDDSYQYPIYPGTEEWKNLKSAEEMLEACQIPAKVLTNMSTQAIIQAILEYPQLWLVFHRYQYQADFVFSELNVCVELTKRKEASETILQLLKVVDPLAEGSERISMVLELLICQNEILAQMNNNSKKKVVKFALRNDKLRQNHLRLSNSDERLIASTLIGKAMVTAGYSPFWNEVKRNDELRRFIEDKWYVYILREENAVVPGIIFFHGSKFSK